VASALIQERMTVSGNQFRMQRINEDAAQTFLQGTPLQINNATGALKAWDGVTITTGIAGICKEFGANLTTAGVPLGTTQPAAGPAATGPGGGITFGSVQNETAAINLTRPYFNDGKTGIVLAIPDNVFYGQVGPTQTTALTDIGKQYGLTKDVDGHWFVDKTKTGASAVLVITNLDTYDTVRGVYFTFLQAVAQILA
jgi:hypothetical protein